MRKSILIVCLFACSCSTTIAPIRGNYPATPIVYTSTKPLDKVWDNIIDLFAQKGLVIRIIDRSSGLIISGQTKLSWSFEDKNGKIINPKASAVIEKMHVKGGKFFYTPEIVTGEWNVRIKTVDDKTSINVNLINILATYGKSYYSSYLHTAITPVEVSGRTTGNFEQSIYDIIK